MRGLIVDAGRSGTGPDRGDLPEPDPADGEILVEALAVGICGTDREIVRGDYGEAPDRAEYLVLGHESLGRVLEDPSGTLADGDLVAGIVRRPDPVPCPNCAVGEWDMCRNGRYTECGIKASCTASPGSGGGSQPRFAVAARPGLGLSGVLLEPTSVVAKAWEHIERIGAPRAVAPAHGAGHRGRADRPAGRAARRAARPRRARAGPDDVGPQARSGRGLGATYHAGPVDRGRPARRTS